MLLSLAWLIADIKYKRALKHCFSWMIQLLRKGAQNGQISRTLKIQHPSRLFRLVIVFESDLLKCLQDLATTIINTVWFANKGNYDITISSLIKNDF